MKHDIQGALLALALVVLGALAGAYCMLASFQYSTRELRTSRELLRGAHTQAVLELDQHMRTNHEPTVDEIAALMHPGYGPGWRVRAILREHMNAEEYVAYMRKRGQ